MSAAGRDRERPSPPGAGGRQGVSRSAPVKVCALGVSFVHVSTLFEFSMKSVNVRVGRVYTGKIFFRIDNSVVRSSAFSLLKFNWRIDAAEAPWEWVYSGRSGMKHRSSDGQGEGLPVKRQLRCLEGSVQGDHLPETRGDVSDLPTVTQCSPKIRILSVCKGWAICSRAQKYLRRYLACVIYSVSVILRRQHD